MTRLTADQTRLPRVASAWPRITPVGHVSEPAICLDTADSAGRAALETCIADTFDRHYRARIEHFLPFLLSLRLSDQLGAVVGLRLAGDSPLFLEHYFNEPVEQAVANAYNTPVDRAGIVEIGNLASVAPGSAALLFGLLPVILHAADIRWVVCTATPQVQAMLGRLDFPSRRICMAAAEALGESETDWGSYYDSTPAVIVGDVEQAMTLALANSHIARLTLTLAPVISKIAATLKAHH